MAMGLIARVLNRLREKAAAERLRAFALSPTTNGWEEALPFEVYEAYGAVHEPVENFLPEEEESDDEVYDLEDSPKRVRMRPSRRDGATRLDNRKPPQGMKTLRRWLKAQVGRPWDQVLADLIAHRLPKRAREVGHPPLDGYGRFLRRSIHPHFKGVKFRELKETAERMVLSVLDESQVIWPGDLYRDKADIIRLKPRLPHVRSQETWWSELPTGEIAVRVKGMWHALTTREMPRPLGEHYYSWTREGFRGQVGDFFCRYYPQREYRQSRDEADGVRHWLPVSTVHRLTGKRQLGKAELRRLGLR
ncbi:MAG: hypothetical protein A3D44_01195 [Candidatus Staskawiczbacteria bacterium RIFCSPHIGHO2_02_FULL_42_22]|uniref:Uncharacterized protein n=1 Tax=Candidatus Staskawiczbacteria bacterium RIFCSPHIGHO2_02_FULL_42_22 TaxID=1802207 RepID=A0A1G2I3P8_9BACT|nr:MAG: hypothetical protein A3D44_01195 [Candidatus Staskawiczbacteria bacterium RIFCSPHIGHO2_02_FULL_42_22]